MTTPTSHPSALALLALALRHDKFLDRFEEDDVAFTGAVRRAIEAMRTLQAVHGTRPDIQALRHALRAHPDALSTLEDARCVDAPVTGYAMHRDLLRSERIKAEVYALAMRYNILNDPFAGQEPADVLERLSTEVTDLRERMALGRNDTVRDGRGMVEAFLEETSQRSRWPISTGFAELDDATTGGFRPGQMIVLGAYTGVGKSAMLCVMASHMVRDFPATSFQAAKKAVPVLVVSIEMSAGEVEARLISHESGLELRALATSGSIDKLAEWQQALLLEVQKRHMANPNIFCDDSPDVDPKRLRAIIRRQVRLHGVKVVFIDYIQLLKSDRRENRVQELDELSREMKVIAKELDVVIVCLAQLNRSANAEGRKPRLSDLRESGGLEANANTVLLLSRRTPDEGETVDESAGQIPVLLQVAKNRSGPTREIKLRFDGTNMSYKPAELAGEDDE